MSRQSCPYCGVAFSLEGVGANLWMPTFKMLGTISAGSRPAPEHKQYTISSHSCPDCAGQVLWLNELMGNDITSVAATTLLFPKRPIKALPPGIPAAFIAEFLEAHDTLEVSPKASAALSRRCLQHVIRQQESIQKANLYDEIKELMARNKLPKYLADDLDAIRHVGNFAAHPIKDTNTGQIVDVEPGEAEWTLQVLEELLIFYFVDASKSRSRRDALNDKLRAAGKPPMP